MAATQPAVFLSHGAPDPGPPGPRDTRILCGSFAPPVAGAGPCFFMEPEGPFSEIARGSPTAQWLRSLPSYCPERPTAVLVISAHWEEQGDFAVTGSDSTSLLFDYGGFPPHTYELEFPAPGAPETARRVEGLVEEATGRRVRVSSCLSC